MTTSEQMLAKLTEVYELWLSHHGLNSISADELHYELLVTEGASAKTRWLEGFIAVWERTEAMCQ